MFTNTLLVILLLFFVGIHANLGKLRRASSGRQRKDKQGCYIVKVKDSGRGRRRELFNKIGSKDGNLLNFTNSFVKCDCRQSEIDQLIDDDDVDYIEEDTVVSVNYQQNITGTNYWNLDRVDQSFLPYDNLFNYQYNGQGVPIYILDTGVNAAHEEFIGRIGQGTDIIGGGDPNVDCNGHGTHVAGTAAGTLSGVAKLSTIVPVRVMGCDGVGSMSAIVLGINWAMAKAPGVISISIGGGFSAAANDAVAAATNSGFVVVVCAGNENTDACTKSPASAPSAITVAATSNTDQRSVYSNYGNCVDIFAPGDSIWSASSTNNTGYLYKTGTSMATPLVAGAVAAYWSGNPSASAQQIATALLNEATIGLVQDLMGSPNLLLKTSAIINFNSRSPSMSPLSASPSPSPVSPSPSPGGAVNDLCPNAIELPCNSVVSGSTMAATFNRSPVMCGTTHTGPEVWYYINVPAGQITLSMCNTANFDTKLTLWGGSCDALQCITGADDTSGCLFTTALTQNVTAGRYIVMVHGYSSLRGNFNLSLTCPSIPSSSPSPLVPPLLPLAPLLPGVLLPASPSNSPRPSLSPNNPSTSQSQLPSPSAVASVSPLASRSPSTSRSLSASGSPSVSAGPSASPSSSSGPSPSNTPSPSVSSSASPSSAPSDSASESPSSSSAPSSSVSPSPAASTSASRSSSPSPKRSPSDSASPASRSPSPSPRTTPSGTPSPISRSPSSSPRPTPSVTPSAASRSPSFSPKYSPSNTPSLPASRSTSPSPRPSLSTTPSRSPSRSPSVSPRPSPSTTPSRSPSAVSHSPSFSSTPSPFPDPSPNGTTSAFASLSSSSSSTPSPSPIASLVGGLGINLNITVNVNAYDNTVSPAYSPKTSPPIAPSPDASANPSDSTSDSPSSSESLSSSESPSPSSELALVPSPSPADSNALSANSSPTPSPVAGGSPSWSPLESPQPSPSQSPSPSPKKGRKRGLGKDRSTSDSMYDEGITEWGYSIGTLGQITSQSPARLAALAGTIEETQMASYKEGFHAQIVTQDDPHFVLSTASRIGLTVSVLDWGSGVAKAVVTSFNIMDVNLRQLGLTQDSTDPYAFLCQVDRLTAEGELANNQSLTLTLKLPQNVPFKVSLHTLDRRGGVDLASAGGYFSPAGPDNVFTIYVPHTSMIAIRAPLPGVDSASPNSYAMLGLLGLLALIPLAGIIFCVMRSMRRRAAVRVEMEQCQPVPLWPEAPVVICRSPGSIAPVSTPHCFSEMETPSHRQLLSSTYNDTFSSEIPSRTMSIV